MEEGEDNLKKLLKLKEKFGEKEFKTILPKHMTGDERQKLKITTKNSLLSKPAIAQKFSPEGTLIMSLYFEHYDKEDYGKAEAKMQDTSIEYPVKYVPTGLTPLNELAEIWDNITLTNDENIVIDALNLVKNVHIEKLNFRSNNYNNKRIPIVKIAGNDTPVPLKNLGEGIARILQLILSFLQVKNGGFLLIDEFENGLHYSIQPKVWELLFKLSAELNVQVFVTSHSKDTIESFSKVWSQYESQGTFYRLSMKKDLIKAVAYTCEDFSDAISSDIEVR
jgi:AAA15 family ATPase/GTPase